TGAACYGRFAGCADIIGQPGRVPPNAPAWSRPDASVGAQRPTPSLATATSAPPMPPPAEAAVQRVAAPPPQASPTAPMAMVAPPTSPSPPPPLPVEPAVTLPEPVVPASPIPTPVSHHPTPDAQPKAGTTSSDLGDLLDVVQQLKAEFRAQQASPDARLAGIEHSIELLAHRLTTPTAVATPPPEPPASQLQPDPEHQLSVLTESVSQMQATQEQALASSHAQTASLHETVEHLAQMVVLARQETSEAAERHRRELHGVRRQLIELRASIDERSDALAREQVDSDIRSIRTTVEELAAHEPGEPATAHELAATLNSLRDAEVEEISAAHLVHSFQVEIRDLRDHLDTLVDNTTDATAAPDEAATVGTTS
ncbi:MAG: hypothetical protein P8N02_03570, partial [Actinomycetota bacterium]|nr:hypothetical protein [Actinomycetota bacterium]